MRLEVSDIQRILDDFFTKAERVRQLGGIARVDAMNGRAVPSGWELLPDIDYFVPPSFTLTIQ